MRDDSEPIGKIRLMKCKAALFMLSLCAKCISNFLDFSVITNVGGDGASQYLHLIFWNILSFSFSFGSLKHNYYIFFSFDLKIWVITKALQEMQLASLGSADGGGGFGQTLLSAYRRSMSAAWIWRHVAVGASHWCCQCHIPVPHWKELLDFEVLSWLLLFKQISCLSEQKPWAVKYCSKAGHLQARLGSSQQTPLPYGESSMHLARVLPVKHQRRLCPEYYHAWAFTGLNQHNVKYYLKETGSVNISHSIFHLRSMTGEPICKPKQIKPSQI